MRKYYTDEEIENEAKKYNTIVDFRKYSLNFYSLAKKRKLMSKFREFLQTKVTNWTYEMLRDEALKYNKKIDFIKNAGSAYKTAHSRGILNNITSHMDQIKIWSYDEAFEESQNYLNRQDFINNSPTYYQSNKNGWLNEFFERTTIKWTKEMAHQEALKYETKVEFKNGSPKGYSAAYTHGWVDDITKHMVPVGNLYNRMVYVFEFPDNHVYIGLTSDKKRRHKDHTNINKVSSPVAKHIIETGLDPIYKEQSVYITAQDAQNLEQYTIDRHRSEGWTILNTNKAGGLGKHKRTELTMEIIRDLASNYPSRVAFKRDHTSEYQIAQKYGWLDDVVANIPIQDMTKWTYEKTKEESKKYKNRGQLKKNNQSAYHSARKNKWLDEFYPKDKRKVYDKVNDITFDTLKSASDYHNIPYGRLLYTLTTAKVNNTGLELV